MLISKMEGEEMETLANEEERSERGEILEVIVLSGGKVHPASAVEELKRGKAPGDCHRVETW